MTMSAWHGALLWFSLVTCLASSLSTNSQNNDHCRARQALPLHVTAPESEASTSNRKQQRGPRDVDFMSNTSSSSSSSGSPKPSTPQQGSQKTQRRKREAMAPLIDSTLLRFLSAQKQTPENTLLTTTTTTTTDAAAFQNEEFIPQPPPPTPLPNNNNGPSNYYHHVLQTLLGMEKNDNNAPMSKQTAHQAAESVRSHVVARTARRRLRLFFKQRDAQLWATTDITAAAAAAPDENDATTTMTTTTTTARGEYWEEEKDLVPPFPYHFEQVVELLVEQGLTANDICTILIHTPSVALMRPRNGEYALERTCQRVLRDLLSESLALRKYDARKVVRNCPGLLTVRGSKNAQEVVTLLSACGVSHTSLARDKHILVTLLSRSPAALFRLASFFSSNAIRMPLCNIGPLLRRAECVPLLNAVAPIIPPPSQLLSQLSGPTSPSSAVVVVAAEERRRQLRQGRQHVEDVYRNMTATAWTLRDTIGTFDLGKVISAYPSVLLLDADEHIVPAASYLMNDLGIFENDLPRVLQLYPALLGMNVDDMKRVSSYLTSLEVSDENLASIVRAFPSLLTLDVEQDIMPVIDFLREIGISNVGRFVTRLPPILGYSVQDELVPKWEYLRKVSTPTQASFELSTFPAYFSYPLDRVIKTRYEYLLNEKRIPTQFLALDVVLRYGDVDFATQVARDADGGAAFRTFAERQRRRRTAPGTKKGRRAANARTGERRRNNNNATL